MKKRFRKYRKQVKEYIEQIYVREDSDAIFRDIYVKRIRLFIIVFLLVFVALIYCILQPEKESVLSGKKLIRQEEEQEVRVVVEGESADGIWQKEMDFSLAGRFFSNKECEELKKHTKAFLEKELPGQNTSLKRVKTKLHFPESVPESGIEISFSTDETYITKEGELLYENIPKEGIQTEIMAEASWKNWSDAFYFTICIAPADEWGNDVVKKQIEEALQKKIKESGGEKEVDLPDRIGNVTLRYSVDKEGKDFRLVFLLCGIVFLLPIYWRQQQKKKVSEREEQLFMDYSELVNKFMLLLGAGLTIRKILERMSEEYERERKEGGVVRYVYEEICVVVQEMKDGVSEKEALEHFGRRCKILPYLRFTSILTQNLKKGAEGVLLILEKESMEAMEQRKEQMLQLGEKAGTKLLFPMMLLFGIVMAIVMVPAFMTM